MPLDNPGTSTGATDAANNPSPNPTPTPSATPAPSGDTGGAGGSLPTQGTPATSSSGTPGATPAVPGAPSVTPPPPSWLDNLRTQGIDFGSDERAALAQIQQLHQNFQQLQQLSPYVSAYTKHAPVFHQWLQQQGQQPAGANDPWYKEFWNPPEFNHGWLEQYVTVDAEGKRGWAPNTPQEVIAKHDGYMAWQRDQLTKLQRNPFEFFGPAIQKLAQQEAAKIVEDRLSQQNTMRSSQDFISQNSNWLYERNADGTVKHNQQINPLTGQYYQAPVLTEWGNLFNKYAREVWQKQQKRGYEDVEEMRSVAQAMVERDYLFAVQTGRVKPPNATGAPNGQPNGTPNGQPNGAPGQTQQDAANNAFLQNNNPPNVLPTNPPTNGTPRFQDGPYPKSVAELEALTLQELKKIGIN